MSSKNVQGFEKVTLAVGFDSKLDHLVRSANVLCRELQAQLRLVHVVDPWTKNYLATSTELTGQKFIEDLQAENLRVAENRMQSLIGAIDKTIETEWEILVGDIAEQLAKDSETSQSNLLLVGAEIKTDKYAENGFVTALEIIGQCQIPVMVLNDRVDIKSRWPRHRIMVADSLREEGLKALELGCHLTRALGGADLLHVHAIEGESYKSKVAEAYKKGEIKDLGDSFVKTREKVEQSMRERVSDVFGDVSLLEGEYHRDISLGNIPAQITAAGNAFLADIAIFGHHEMYHKEPFTIGRVPFRAMLNQSRAVIVV